MGKERQKNKNNKTYRNSNNWQAKTSSRKDVIVVLSESLHAACGPPLDSDVIVHDTIDICAGVVIGITEDCFGGSVGINKVMVHSKVVSQFMSQDLKT